jgi:hypothetical protein
MKTVLIFRKKPIPALGLIFLLLGALSALIWSCKDESFAQPSSGEKFITYRDDDDRLETGDLLELLGESCVPGSIINVGLGCNDVEFIDTVNITLPSYTGCTFTVVYKYYICSAAGLTDYTMSDFQILSHNCSAFSTALVSAFAAGGSTLAAFVESFDFAIYSQLQNRVITNYVGPHQYLCGEGLFFSILFTRASCYKRCIIEHSNHTSSLVKIACGVDCCERHTRVCRDENGALVIETENVHPSEPYCADPPDFSENPVMLKCVQTTSCQYKCPAD